MIPDPDVVAEAIEIVAIAEVELADSAEPSPAFPFSPAEVAFARSVSDPERRLSARLAAKRAAVRALGGDTVLWDVEVIREPGGAPRLRLSASAERRLHGLGATRALVSLTHGRTHGAASVILLRGTP